MDASIETERDGTLRVLVTDNLLHRHRIALSPDGEIRSHECDALPDDPTDRTGRDRRRAMQVRRYARYRVSGERGHDAVAWDHHPGRAAAALVAVAGLPEAAFADRFGEHYCRVVGHRREDVDPAVEPPVAFDAGDRPVIYLLDLYLAGDPDDYRDLELRVGEAVSAFVGDADARGEPIGRTPAQLREWLRETAGRTPDFEESVAVEAASGIHATYGLGDGAADPGGDPAPDTVSDPDWKGDPNGGVRIARGSDPRPGEDPDARIRLYPLALDSLAAFRSYVLVNLVGQIRDCYVGMGLDPPEPYLVVAPGKWLLTERFRVGPELDFL